MKARVLMHILFTFSLALSLLLQPFYAFADDLSAIEALRQEIVTLREELKTTRSQLDSANERLGAVESKIGQEIAGRTPAPSSGGSAPVAAISEIARGLQLHGGASSSYIFNTNTPVAPNAQTNNLRTFDREANGFTFDMAQITIEKPVSKDSLVGFRVDLDYGNDAKYIHSAGLGNANDEFDLQQAYAQIMLPWTAPGMDTLSFKVGKFVTLMGAEVIESWNNWNFSRSLLFGYAIPFTETGIRAYYKPFSNLPIETYFGVVNGWDVATDNNRAKTLEAQVVVAPTDKLSVAVGGMMGAERADSNKDLRNLIDIVATYRVTDKLTLKANYDYAFETNGASDLAGYTDDKDSSWSGIALYARYDIYDWWAISGRCEYFDDADGVRTGYLTNGSMPISDVEIFEYTLTNEFKLWKNMLFRFEYRYDKANGQIYTKDKTTSNNQSTLAAEVAYIF